MVRNYVRRTMQGKTDPKKMLQAARIVRLQGLTCKQVARDYGIKYRTLTKYIRLFSEDDIYGTHSTPSINVGYRSGTGLILSAELESKLAEYLIKAANICFGLSSVQIRKMGYELALMNNCKVPPTWHGSKAAGIDWYNAFMKRHPSLAVNMEKITTLSETPNYGQGKINLFFSKLNEIMERECFKARNIWNMHETGVFLSENSGYKVITRGYGHVNGYKDLTTIAITISASGWYMLPVFDYENVIKKKQSTYVSTWMDEDKFFKYLKDFIKYENCTINKPTLLIIDNQSYLSIKAMDYAESHGLVLLSYPKYCSHVLQPLLEKSLYTKFINTIKDSCKEWKKDNPEKQLFHDDIRQIVLKKFSTIFSKVNIAKAFKNKGIFPLKRMILSDTESERVRSEAACFDGVDDEMKQYQDENEDVEMEIDKDEDDDDDDDDDSDLNEPNQTSSFYEEVMSELLIGGLVDQAATFSSSDVNNPVPSTSKDFLKPSRSAKVVTNRSKIAQVNIK